MDLAIAKLGRIYYDTESAVFVYETEVTRGVNSFHFF